jgi:hypothetical protein
LEENQAVAKQTFDFTQYVNEKPKVLSICEKRSFEVDELDEIKRYVVVEINVILGGHIYAERR